MQEILYQLAVRKETSQKGRGERLMPLAGRQVVTPVERRSLEPRAVTLSPIINRPVLLTKTTSHRGFTHSVKAAAGSRVAK
jgi:hypothetical protein